MDKRDSLKYTLALLALSASFPALVPIAIPIGAANILGDIIIDLVPSSGFDEKVQRQYKLALENAIKATIKSGEIDRKTFRKMQRLAKTYPIAESQEAQISELLTKYCSSISGDEINFPGNIAIIEKLKSNFTRIAREYHELSQQIMNNEIEDLKARLESFVFDDNVHNDNRIYKEAYYEELFLEDVLNDGQHARLCDVYVTPKYSVPRSKKTGLSVYKMIRGFLTNREAFILQQDSTFPIINKRIFAIILFGKPGSGKSSFVAYLAATMTKNELQNRQLNIIRLRDMLEEQINSPDPLKGILAYLQTNERSLKQSILILDGLDEICAMYHEVDFHLYLKRLLQNLKSILGIQVVITSRLGYFKLDDDITSFCLTVNLDDWDNRDLNKWGLNYLKKHQQLRGVIQQNTKHLQNEKFSDKKSIFAVPILFYMANARGEYLENHKNICSVYDAVLRDVFENRIYDRTPYNALKDLISPSLSRQICREIAFTMFRSGRVLLNAEGDPFLSPDEVEAAIDQAMCIQPKESGEFGVNEKKKIKDMFALTFYYNKKFQTRNAVEFAHKSIAEYFAAEKILELLFAKTAKSDSKNLCEALEECFGYMPITTEISSFLNEKIHTCADEDEIRKLKNIIESKLRSIVVSGELFDNSVDKKSSIHSLDRIVVLFKSALILFEYLDCQENTNHSTLEYETFNIVLANISKMIATRSQHNMMLPLSLNGFYLMNGDFSCCEFGEAHLCEALLKDAKFTDANLVDAQLNRAIIKCTDFSGANLAGADLTNLSNVDAADFTQAKMQGADLSNSQFYKTSFEAAEMQGAQLDNCVFGEGCHFEDANLFDASLMGTDVSKADITGIVFVDEDDAEDQAAVFEIAGLILSREQNDYLKSFSNIKLRSNCRII